MGSGNLSSFDVIGSKEHGIAGDDIVTTGNAESCQWQHRISKILSPQLSHALLN